MLTIKAEIKRGEKKVDGTYNVKLRFTLDRKVKRLSTSLFVKPEELTKTGDFKRNTKIYKEIEALLTAYQSKCNAMQTDLNHYSLDYIFKLLKFEEQKEKQIDFIAFSREWIAHAPMKRTDTYETTIRSVISFIGKDCLDVSEINVSFLNKYTEYLNKRRDERNHKLSIAGKRIPSNRTVSLYLGCIRHLFKEAQRKYNNTEDNLMLIPSSPFDNFKIPRQEATRKRALDRNTIKAIWKLPYKNKVKGYKSTCRYDLAKDCFIMSFCLMGMNSVDLYNATEFIDGKIIYNRTKTKDRRLDNARMEVIVPKLILPLIEKYKDKTGQRLFSFHHYYSDHKAFNKAINYGLKEIGSQLGIDDLEYYAARHSWATIALNKIGIDKYTVHAALNHVDESMRVTDIYIQRDFVNENKANAKVVRYVFGR
jgi:transposase